MDCAAETTLALHEDSNSCAALFVDGRLEFAAAEERFTRVRFHAGRPERTLASIRQRYGLGTDNVSALVAANCFSFLPSLPMPVLPQAEHNVFGLAHKAYVRYQESLWNSQITRRAAGAMTRGLLGRRFPRIACVVDHHTAHAYSAYMTSGFAEATAITADGFGDGKSSKVFRCQAGRCDELYSVSALDSVGIFHAEMAQLLGIDARLGGKVPGMAAYGDPSRAYPLVAQLIQLAPGGRGFVLPPLAARRRGRSPYAELAQLPKQDVAAAVQKRLEDVFLPYVEVAMADSGIRDLVLAGGVFGNVKLTQRILELPCVGRVFVHPAMNDHGIAVGAGLESSPANAAPPTRLPNVFLGTEYSDEEWRTPSTRTACNIARRRTSTRASRHCWQRADRGALQRTDGVRTARSGESQHPLPQRRSLGERLAQPHAAPTRVHALRAGYAGRGGGGMLRRFVARCGMRALHDRRRPLHGVHAPCFSGQYSHRRPRPAGHDRAGQSRLLPDPAALPRAHRHPERDQYVVQHARRTDRLYAG
jgi:predicted NodU family carbamoyl transferase